MTNLISFKDHPRTKEKEEAIYFLKECTLINGDTELPTCYGYDNKECTECEVPKHYNAARTKLTKLLLTESI